MRTAPAQNEEIRGKTAIEAAPPTFFRTPQDRQSVRTTFKLSERALEAKAWLSGYWRISQKDVMDHVAEAALKTESSFLRGIPNIAELGMPENIEDLKAQRRTHVISRGALRVIEEAAGEAGLDRDIVIEVILRLLGLRARDAEAQTIDRRERGERMIRRFYENGNDLENEICSLLGEDDPVVLRMRRIQYIILNLAESIQEEREEGTPIEPDCDFQII